MRRALRPRRRLPRRVRRIRRLGRAGSPGHARAGADRSGRGRGGGHRLPPGLTRHPLRSSTRSNPKRRGVSHGEGRGRDAKSPSRGSRDRRRSRAQQRRGRLASAAAPPRATTLCTTPSRQRSPGRQQRAGQARVPRVPSVGMRQRQRSVGLHGVTSSRGILQVRCLGAPASLLLDPALERRNAVMKKNFKFNGFYWE